MKEMKMKALQSLGPSALSAAIRDKALPAADPMSLNAGLEITVFEPTPSSVAQPAGPSDGPGTHKRRPFSPPPSAEPWRPFFKTREDFVFTEIIIEAGMSKDQTERLLKVIKRCIDGKGSLSLSSYTDVQSAWTRKRAASKLVPVSSGTVI